MADIGLRQLSILLVGVLMTVVGYLGLTGALTIRALLIGGILVGVAVMAFHLGQIDDRPRRA